MPGIYQTSDQAAASQVSVTTSDTAVAPANVARRRIVLRNNDATNPVYISHTTATTSHFFLKATESLEIRSQAAIRAIATGGTVVVSVWEEFD